MLRHERRYLFSLFVNTYSFMNPLANQIQDLLEALDHLRYEQQSILSRNHISDSNQLGSLPNHELKAYQRLQRERNAKGKFLADLAGTSDDLKLLLGQIYRLSKAREQLLYKWGTKNPLELPPIELTEYSHLWKLSDRVADMLDRLCRETNQITCASKQ